MTASAPAGRDWTTGWGIAGLAALAALMLALLYQPITNIDVWLQIATGKQIVDTGHVPTSDPFSFTANERTWVSHEWLSGLLLYGVDSVSGAVGLTLLMALVCSGALATHLLTARRLGAPVAVMVPAAAVAIYIAAGRFAVRPHVFTFLLAAVYLHLLLRFWHERTTRGLLALPVLQTVWANLHGGHILGTVLVATFALAESLSSLRERVTGRTAVSARHVGRLWLLVALCAAASTVSPHGVRNLLFPFELTGSKLFMTQNFEWFPPYVAPINGSTMFVFYLVLLAAVTALFFVVHGSGNSGVARSRLDAGLWALLVVWVLFAVGLAVTGNWDERGLAVLLHAMLGLFVVFCLSHLRTIDFAHAGLLALLEILCLRHQRSLGDAALALVSMVAVLVATHRQRALARTAAPRLRPGLARWLATAGIGLLVGVAAFTVHAGYRYDFAGERRPTGLGVDRSLPLCAADFLIDAGIKGNAFVSYPYAGYLVYAGYPAVRVNFDSRNEVYGEELAAEYLNALVRPVAMAEYLERHQIDFFLLTYADYHEDVMRVITSRGYLPIYYDDRGFILARASAAPGDRVARSALHFLGPMERVGRERLDAQSATGLLAEAERCLRPCPDQVLGNAHKLLALMALARFDEAVAVGEGIIQRVPEFLPAYMPLAQAHDSIGQRPRAIELLQSVLRRDPTQAEARRVLTRIDPANVP